MSGLYTNGIASARKLRGYTQEQVAKALGLSRPTYINIEAGKRELTLNQANILMSYLHITMDDILGIADGASSLSDLTKLTSKYKQIILNALFYGADTKDQKITKTKLAKLVYLTDFTWYYLKSKSMSQMTYRKYPQGPVSDVYFRAIDELEEDGIIIREERGKAFLYSLTEDNIPNNELSNEELNLIKKICKVWKDKPTSEIVEFTHNQLPWQICRDGEIIPYGLITQEEPEKIYGGAKL